MMQEDRTKVQTLLGVNMVVEAGNQKPPDC